MESQVRLEKLELYDNAVEELEQLEVRVWGFIAFFSCFFRVFFCFFLAFSPPTPPNLPLLSPLPPSSPLPPTFPSPLPLPPSPPLSPGSWQDSRGFLRHGRGLCRGRRGTLTDVDTRSSRQPHPFHPPPCYHLPIPPPGSHSHRHSPRPLEEMRMRRDDFKDGRGQGRRGFMEDRGVH